MTTNLAFPSTSSTLLARLIDSPDLVRTVRALPPPAFSALIQRVGIEDAGELVALATTAQLVAAFDEDLFVAARAGEREEFDVERFVVWLEVLLEAGDQVAACRVAELSEDFVAHALGSLVMVLDHDALLARMSEGGDDAEQADKAIESSLSEELDGYLLIARRHEGWDAALALIVALDRDHRAFLVRVLDRCAAIASGHIDDLKELSTALSAEDSLAEDVEAAREERRARRGYVDPRAARSFLSLARRPRAADAGATERDPVTRAYFRDLARSHTPASTAASSPKVAGLLRAIEEVEPRAALPPPSEARAASTVEAPEPLVDVMRLLGEREPRIFSERMEELSYLANVLMAGAETKSGRFRASEAAEAALATVALGAELSARRPVAASRSGARHATTDELYEVLRTTPADVLFREASSALAARKASTSFLRSRAELAAALKPTAPRKKTARRPA